MEFSPSLISHQASVDVKQYLLTYIYPRTTRYINSTKGTSSKKDAPSGIYIPSISGSLDDTGVYRHTTEPVFIRDWA